MSSRKAILAATAALLALGGGGAAAWVATSGDDAAPLRGFASATTSDEPTEATPTAPGSDPPAPGTGSETTPEQAQQPAPESSEGSSARKTRFPRERVKAQDDPPQRQFAIPPAREFSGTGNATLGTVDLRQPAVVKWSTKGRFELRFGREDFPIIAPSTSGQLIVPPYSFERVRVIAQGRWRISITPQN